MTTTPRSVMAAYTRKFSVTGEGRGGRGGGGGGGGGDNSIMVPAGTRVWRRMARWWTGKAAAFAHVLSKFKLFEAK